MWPENNKLPVQALLINVLGILQDLHRSFALADQILWKLFLVQV